MSDYKRNPRSARRARKSLSRKAVVVLSLMMVLVLAAVGGTIAWLTDETEAVTNTFTVGDINIDLTETTNDYKMVPGNLIDKDPKVTVKAGSEDCWLFVKVQESSVLDDYITYAVNTAAGEWTVLTSNADGSERVYYRAVSANATANQDFYVLTDTDSDGKTNVIVNEGVTKAQMEALKATGAVQPTLTFTAYAVQQDNLTVHQAWQKIDSTYVIPNP